MKRFTALLIALLTAASLTACMDSSDDQEGTSDNPSEGASVQMQDKGTNPTQGEGDNPN